MSELLPAPRRAKFPLLSQDPSWLRELPTGTMLARIYRRSGPHPTEWYEFRRYGPLDGRFDPHPLPTDTHESAGVFYAAVETSEVLPHAPSDDTTQSAFAACLLEVFQQHRLIDRATFDPALVMFEIERPLRLLDLAESDWITVAGGNAAISSGQRARAREWARAIHAHYPDLDGVIAPSSLIPTARIATLWHPAQTAIPDLPEADMQLARGELSGVIDAIAARYGYTLLDGILSSSR